VYFSLRPRSAMPAPPGATQAAQRDARAARREAALRAGAFAPAARRVRRHAAQVIRHAGVAAALDILGRHGLHLVEADLVRAADQRTRDFEPLDLRDLVLSGRRRVRLGRRGRILRGRLRDRCAAGRRLALRKCRRSQRGRQRHLRPDHPLDRQRQSSLLHLAPLVHRLESAGFASGSRESPPDRGRLHTGPVIADLLPALLRFSFYPPHHQSS